MSLAFKNSKGAAAQPYPGLVTCMIMIAACRPIHNNPWVISPCGSEADDQKTCKKYTQDKSTELTVNEIWKLVWYIFGLVYNKTHHDWSHVKKRPRKSKEIFCFHRVRYLVVSYAVLF